MQPLAGIRILDLTRLIPGGLTTLYLSDLGAEVIKVEVPPLGDYDRSYDKLVGDFSVLFTVLNRGKKSFALDFRTAEGARTLRELIQSADVLLEGAVPGSMKKYGFDYAACAQINPRLVYCSLTLYGQTGPMAALPSHGMNLDAMAGLMAIVESKDGSPVGQPPTFGGLRPSLVFGASSTATGICAALAARASTGKGCYIDASFLDASLTIDPYRAAMELNDLDITPRTAGPETPALAPYRTKDGILVMICAVEGAFWERFCDAIGLPQIKSVRGAGDFDLGQGFEKVYAGVSAAIKTKTFQEWSDIFKRAKVPFSELASGSRRYSTEQAQSRNLTRQCLLSSGATLTLPAGALVFDGERNVGGYTPGPALGEHTEELRAKLLGR